MSEYDCTNDVLAHKNRVSWWISWINYILVWRAKHHDESKLLPPEKDIFDEYTPKLKELKFGSDEYKSALEKMGEGLRHHYDNNPHHPEHFKKGIDDMTLWDLTEMVADWMAAASIKDKNIDLDYLQRRFNLSPQLRHIIYNTLWAADMDAINNNVPLEYQQIMNFASNNEENESKDTTSEDEI